MPDQTAAKFTPAVLAQAREATSGLQLAANNTGTGEYRLVYYAVSGCGDMHSYSNLRRADALPNVRLNYINAFDPEKPFPGAPGIQLLGNPYTGQRFGNVAGVINKFSVPFKMELSEAPHILLIAPNGRVVREFANSTSATFVNEVARLTGNAPQRATGASRG